jgi:hypothetical protein
MTRRFSQVALASLFCWLLPAYAAAQETIVSGMTWMTQFPSTWNAGAPKLVSDGLFYYAVICGPGGSSSLCTVARKRGDGTDAWTFSSRSFWTSQPASVVIDRKGRLNIFYNDYQLRHLRIDVPSVRIDDWTAISTGFSPNVGYLHASYNAVGDELIVTFNETSTWTLYVGRKNGEGPWTYSALPAAPPGVIYMYARTVAMPGRYAVLVGEHTVSGPNFAYTAALMFEATSASGPWTTRELHRVTGNNLGVPYENWVLANDLQIDSAGRLRAMLHITELGSGRPNPLDGVFILREEDNYVPRFIASGIEDGFTLYVDPSGVHLAFTRDVATPSASAGIVWFRSDDHGATWQKQLNGFVRLINPVLVDLRSGSMIAPDLHILASDWNNFGPFDRVLFGGITLNVAETDDRYAHEYVDDDGTVDYIRGFRDVPSGRSFYYIYDRELDGSYTWNYSYSAGGYYQVYTAHSDGSYRYYNADGVDIVAGVPVLTGITPATAPVGTAATLTVNGRNFRMASTININGIARATTYVSATQLTAPIVPGDLAIAGASLAITVTNPAPDPALSNMLSLTIAASPATLTPAATTAGAGGVVSLTVTNGPGNRRDWVGWFCPTTNGDLVFADWKFFTNTRVAPAAGATSATITFTAPTTGGASCNARLFADNGFVKLVTSATITVANPVPAVASLNPGTVVAGSAAAIVVTGANFVPSSVGHVNGVARATTFVSATQLSVAVLAGDVATVGVNPAITVVNFAPGGGTSNAVALVVAAAPPAPTITVQDFMGGTVPHNWTTSVTVANGPGNTTDWVGWYCPSSEPDRAYMDWKYLNNSKTAPATGISSATITFMTPFNGGGSCEARLFAHNGFRKLAADSSVSVVSWDWIFFLNIFATANAPGGTFSVSYQHSPPATPATSLRDWVGLFCPTTSGHMAYVDWKYLNDSRTAPTSIGPDYGRATLTTTSPPGTKCEARVFYNDGFAPTLRSWTVTVAAPAVTVPYAAATGAPVAVSVDAGPGNARDWVGMYCPAANGDMMFADWKYLNSTKTPPVSGVSAATVTFTAPGTPGECNFRLFADNGFARLAASELVTVQ